MSANIDLLDKLVHEEFEIVDLTHDLEEGIPSCGTHARFGRILHESIEWGDQFTHAYLGRAHGHPHGLAEPPHPQLRSHD